MNAKKEMVGRMQVAFLATKLNPPPVQRELVPRPRLIDRLNRGLEGKLTLVSTPAGYGKTMLLTAWADQCKIPVAWISLDEGDNDPARFLLYLVAALAKIMPDIDKGISTLLQSPRIPPQEEMLARLLHEIDQVKQPFVLVLDDYHLVYELAIHNALLYLLDHLPPKMHLIIASRSDPPLRLARLRALSELTELRLVDLYFTLDETTQFFNSIMNLSLKDDQISALNTRTEGWIAGLQMAAISLKGSNNQSNFIKSFSGSNRFILDYLVEEVLRGQPEEVQIFLLKTSILDRLAAPLCDAVTGLNNSQEILERLEHANLFIIPLDEERSWYRYHQLFLDLLRKLTQQQYPGAVAGWQIAASQWFEAQGYLEDAIEYALAARDFERSADLIEGVAQPTLLRSEIYTFRGWVNRLPEENVCVRPDLILFYAWVLVLTDSPADNVNAWLNKVDTSSAGIASKIKLIQGYREFMQGGVTRAIPLLQQSLDSLPAGETLFRGVATWLLSLFYVTVGDFHTGSQALEEVVRTSLEKKQLIVAAGALCALAEIHLRLGQLHEAKQAYERALSIAQDARGRLPVSARALMGLGDLWREWNDLEQAKRYCLDGIELAKYLRESTAIAGSITLARIYQTIGEVNLSHEAIQNAWELARQTKETGLDDLYVWLYRANLEIMRGDLEAAEFWIKERGLTGEFDQTDLDQKDNYYKYHILKYELLVSARWFIAINQPQKALTLLTQLLSKMEEQGRIHLVIECLLLSALAYRKLGDQIQAMICFEHSLVLAEPGNYIRVFLDEGSAVRQLLQAASQVESTAAYANRLLAALESEAQHGIQEGFTQKIIPSQTCPLVEPLTEREIEILDLIAKGLSNQEIAQSLFISLPTVKWHTTNIYNKLGVRSRTQAVVQARSVGILPAG